MRPGWLFGITILVLASAAFFAYRAHGATPATASSAQVSSGSDGVQVNVPYGPEPLRLDVYQPTERGTPSCPAIVLIHGGGWSSFDKNTMKSMGEFLARSGFVAFAVDYRLLHGSENRWPAQLDDVQRAVRWIRANADKYGVNPDKIGAFGHSAGAQLAALLGMEDTRDNSDPALEKYSSRVQAVVDYNGPTDLTAEHSPEGIAFLGNFLGADYSKHPEIWQNASPAFQVAKTDAPFLILHGTHDEDVPIAESEELYEKLTAAGVPVSFIKIDDGHRFEKPENRRRLAIETRHFFDQYLGTPH